MAGKVFSERTLEAHPADELVAQLDSSIVPLHEKKPAPGRHEPKRERIAAAALVARIGEDRALRTEGGDRMPDQPTGQRPTACYPRSLGIVELPVDSGVDAQTSDQVDTVVKGTQMDVARDALGIGRKAAQLYLERFDADGITRRVGDERILRRR